MDFSPISSRSTGSENPKAGRSRTGTSGVGGSGTSRSVSASNGKRASSGGKITVHKTIDAADYMYRIATARTASRVSAILRGARADLQFVKKSGASQEDVAKAEKILKRVISKSKLKIKRLKQEQEIARQQKLAESAKKEALQKELTEKLRKKQRARTAQEAADMGDTEHVEISSSQENCPFSPAAYPGLSVSGTIDLTAEGVPAAEPSAVDITL